MTGAIQALTPTYSFNLINFDYPRWHTYEQANWTKIDGILSTITGGLVIRGAWQNATSYNVNDLVIDNSVTPSVVYQVLIAHNSTASPTTFAQDRANNPTYWKQRADPLIQTGYGLTGGPVNGSGTIAIDQTQLPLTGRRNLLFNSNGMVAQRYGQNAATAAAVFSANNNYIMDRWNCTTSLASAGVLVQSISYPAVGIDSCIRVLKPSGNVGTALIELVQNILAFNAARLQGKTVTLSFALRNGVGFDAGNVALSLISGTAPNEGMTALKNGTWTGQATVGTVNAVPTNSNAFVRYSATMVVPANAQELAVKVSTTFPAAAAAANDFIDIRDVQLEIGSFDTTHVVPEYVTYEEELLRCSAYYNEIVPVMTLVSQGAGTYVFPTNFPKMRGLPLCTQKAAPAMNGISGITLFARNGNSGCFSVNVTAGSGTTWSTDNGVYALNAEL